MGSPWQESFGGTDNEGKLSSKNSGIKGLDETDAAGKISGKGIEKKLQKSCSKDAADAIRTDSVTKTAGWVDEAIKVNSKDAGIKGFDE